MQEKKPLVGSEPSFLENALDTATSFASDTVGSIGSFFEDAKDVVMDLPETVTEVWDNAVSPITNKGFRDMLKPPKAELDDEEKSLVKELADFDYADMTWGTLNGLKKLGIDKVKGTKIDNNLVPGLKKEDFEKKMATFNDELQKANKDMEDIASSDPKFKRYRDYENSVRESYLADRGITSIKDEADFNGYFQEKFAALDPIEQRNVSLEGRMLNDTLESFKQRYDDKEKEMKAFLDTNVTATEGKTGSQLYEEQRKENEKFVNENKFLQSTQRVRDMEQRKLREELQKDPKVKIGIGTYYSDLESQMLDDRTERKQYELSIRGMKDVRDVDKIADLYRESAEKLNELDMETARVYASMGSDPQYKGLSEVEKKEKAQAKAYWSFTKEDRKKMSDARDTVSGFAQHRLYEQTYDGKMEFTDVWKGVQSVFSTWDRVLNDVWDRAVDGEKDVPHFIKQEQRNLLYSAEGNMAKLGSVLSYNLDAISGIVLASKAVGLPVKWADSIITKTASAASKGVMVNGVRIGLSDTVLKYVPRTASKLAESLITGIATDPIIDNLMVQAPTKASDGFNAITGVMFDATLLGAGKTLGIGAGKAYDVSMNKFMWSKMIDENKDVAREAAPYLSEKLGVKMDEIATAKMFKAAEDMFYNAYDPKVVKDLFETRGSLHRYMLDTVKKGMDELGIDQVLDGTGLGISRNVLLGMKKSDFSEISKLIEVPATDPTKFRLAQAALSTKLNDIESFAKGKDIYNGNRVSRTVLNTPQFQKDSADVVSSITRFKLAETPEAKSLALEELDSKLFQFSNDYSVIKTKGYYDIVDPIDTKNQIRISIDDLRELSDLKDKNLADLIAEGKVTIKENEKGIKATTYDIKSDMMARTDDFRRKFVNDSMPKVNDYVESRRAEGFPYGISNQAVAESIRAGMHNVLKGGIGMFDHLLDFQVKTKSQEELLFSEMRSLGKFITDRMEEYFGKENVGDGTFINDTFKTDKETWMALPSDIIKKMGENPKPLNLLFGSPKKKGTTDLAGNVFYVTMGKPFKDQEAFDEMLSFVPTSKKGAMTNYNQNVNSILQTVSKYGIDARNGTFDVAEGIRKAAIVNYVRPGTELFHNGQLVAKEIYRIVDEAIPDADNAIKSFVYKVVENVDESQSLLVRPMAYNLAVKYAEAKPLLDALFSKFKVDSPKANEMVSIFANLLVSPKTYADISKKLVKQDDMMDLDVLRNAANEEWQAFRKALETDAERIQMNVDNMKQFAKATKDPVLKAEMKANIEKEVKKLNNIETFVSSETKMKQYLNGTMERMVTQLVKSNVQDTAETVAKTALVGQLTARTASLRQSLADAVEMNAKLETLKNDEAATSRIKDFASKANDADKDLELQRDLSDIVSMETNETVKSVMEEMLSKIGTKDDGFNFVDSEMINRQLGERFDNVFTREYLLENNPISERVKALANDAQSMRDPEFDKHFLDQFEPGFKGNLFELYNGKTEGSKKFKEIIDGLIVKDANSSPNKQPLFNAIKNAIDKTGVAYKADDTKEEITFELLEAANEDGSIVASFKNVARMESNARDIMLFLDEKTTFSKGKKSKEKTLLKQEGKYYEKVWQIDRMRETMDVRFVRGIDTEGFEHIPVGQSTIGKMVRNAVSKAFRKTRNAELSYVTSANVFKEIVHAVNGNKPSEFTDIAREWLGMRDGEFLMGGFGDKDSVFTLYAMPDFLKVSASDIDKAAIASKMFEIEYALNMGYYVDGSPSMAKFKEAFSKNRSPVSTYEDFLKRAQSAIGEGNALLDTDKIRKRESAQMSNFSTFDEVKKPINKLLILEEIFDYDDVQVYLANNSVDGAWDIATINKALSMDRNSRFAYEMERIRSMYEGDEKTFVEKANGYAKLHIKELTDGTSYVTEDISKLRSDIKGLKETEDEFKDHFYGDTKRGRILAKTLFSVADITDGSKKLDNTVAVGKESFKLKGSYEKELKANEKKLPEDSKYVWVDGRKRRVLLEIDGTEAGIDTSFFKNASSDSTKERFTQTVGSSVQAHLDYPYAKEMEETQKEMISKAFDETIGTLTSAKVTFNSLSTIDKQVQSILSQHNVGYGTMSIKKAKLDEFMRKVDKIVNKTQEFGEGTHIKQASRIITPEEVIVNRGSKIAKKMLEIQKEKLKAIDAIEGKSPEEKELMRRTVIDQGHWVVAYRFPVPTKFNPGAYKVRFADEFSDKELTEAGISVGKKQSVFHPIAVYNKMEADYDGDKAILVPADSAIGKSLAKQVIGKGVDVDVLKELNDPEFKNAFIVTDQVNKLGDGKKASKTVANNMGDHVNSITPEFDKLPGYDSKKRSMAYAGIGSRQTPPDVQEFFEKIASQLADAGYTLRSGGAEGADKAFERGAGKKDIFYAKHANDTTRMIAKEIHPMPDRLGGYGLDLMARNTNQLFGQKLDTPVDFVIAWTPDGVTKTSERSIASGGTGQAIDMASRKGIPVFNVKSKEGREGLVKLLKNIKNGEWEDLSAVTDQANKGAKPDRKEAISLEDSRVNAVEAKQSVGIVSATIRTLDLMYQSFQRFEASKFDEAYGNTIVGTRTVKQLYDEFGEAMTSQDRTKYLSYVASVLQTTLDFGNSGLDKFDKSWFVGMLEKAGIKNQVEFYTEIITPFSVGYGKFDFTPTNVAERWKTKNPAEGTSKKSYEANMAERYEDVHGTLGSRRELIEHVIDTFGEAIDELRKNPDTEIISKYLDATKGKTGDPYIEQTMDAFRMEFKKNAKSSIEKKLESARKLYAIVRGEAKTESIEPELPSVGKEVYDYKETPEFSKLHDYDPKKRSMTYAGIGSRDTPPEVQEFFTEIASLLSDAGYTLRSGGAKGADMAFEKGAGKKEIFYAKDATDTTRAIAKEIHPMPDKLSGYGLDLMARNTNQLFGKGLDTPADFVIAWTPDGVTKTSERSIKSGGTGQAIDMASRKGIPVFNVKNKAGREGLVRLLATLKRGEWEELSSINKADAEPIETAKSSADPKSLTITFPGQAKLLSYMEEIAKTKKDLEGKGTYESEKAWTALYGKLLKDKDVSDTHRIMLAGFANFIGERSMASFLSEKQVLAYAALSDKILNKSFEKLSKQKLSPVKGKFEGLSVKETLDLAEAKNVELESLVSEYSQFTGGETTRKMELLEERISVAKEELDELNAISKSFQDEAKEVIDNANENMVKMPIYEFSEAKLPEISYDSVDRSPDTINQILSNNVDFAATARRGIKLTLQSLFDKFAPEVSVRYHTIFGLSSTSEALKSATEAHVKEISHRIFGTGKSMYAMARKTGMGSEETENIMQATARKMLAHQGTKFMPAKKEAVVDELRKLYAGTKAAGLTENEDFLKRVDAYLEEVITPVSNHLNEVQKLYGIDLKKLYGKMDKSIITDVIESGKGDPEFALKTMGINEQKKFENMLDDNAVRLGIKMSEFQKRVMTKIMYKGKTNGLEKLLGFLQSFHYSMSYGTLASIFTQNSFIAGIAQILPNYMELRAILSSNEKELGESYQIMRDYKLAGSEDVIAHGTGLGKNLRENAFDQTLEALTKRMVSAGAEKTGASKQSARRAGEIVDSAINNMLGFNDWPLEHMRKLAAVRVAMDKLGFKDKKALDAFIEKGGQRALQGFNQKVLMEFANSGGGVASSSVISRGTVFEHMDLHIDNAIGNYIASFAVKSLGYLMGWSLHKAANMMEKEWSFLTGIKLFMEGDRAGAKAHIADFSRYNWMLAQTVVNATGLYLKFQKYERNNEDRMGWGDFQKSFNNAVVSMEILYARHKDAFSIAGEHGATTSQQVGYSAYTVVDRMFRMFKQTQFVNTMFDHYRLSEALDEESMVASLKYAMDKHYTSFMRFNGMNVADDYNKTVMAQGNLGILGTGGDTYYDKSYDDLFVSRDFLAWMKKGSIMKFVDTFHWLRGSEGTQLGFATATDAAIRITDRIKQDEHLSKLTKGGQIGSGENDYNLTRLIGNPNAKLTPQETEAMAKLWQKINFDAYSVLDSKGNRIKYDGVDIDESKMQSITEAEITKALAKKGINIEDLIAENTADTPARTKTLAVLALDSNLKTPLVINALITLTAKKMEDEIKKTKGAEGTSGYKELSPETRNVIRKNAILKYQEYFNLNNETVKTVIDQDIRMYHGDLLDKLNSIGSNEAIKNSVIDLMNTEYLVSNVRKTQSDSTSVDKLQSRYTMALKGIDMSSPIGVSIALKFMNDIEDAPFMDAKSKLAHQAAVLYGLNKTQYDLLKDNEKFSKLTEKAQKQLVNWAYKISSDTVDFDSNKLTTKVNRAASDWKATKNFRPNFKSKAMSGDRPNFSKQFEPVRQYFKGREGMVSDSPREYLEASKDFMPQSFGINQARFPIMQEYFKLFIKGEFYGYESKGILPSYVVKPKVDGEQKRYINIKKAKKAQPKRSQGGSYEPPKKVSGGAWAGMPLSNMQK